MHRAILEACVPCLIALTAAFVVLWLVVRISGARLNLRRLTQLHRCQDGGVQSLAFVITLPLFIVIVMFIVQMSQLMVGIMMVNYSAYTAARAASVWLPARVDGVDDQAVDGTVRPFNQNLIDISAYDEIGDEFYLYPADNSYKFAQIRTAAVLACAPMCPSRNLGINDASVDSYSLSAVGPMQRMYRALAPSTAANGRINPRLANKIAYSDLNTFVILSWRDANGGRGRETYRSPTYNPRNHPRLDIRWEPGEVGWQD
ncbi:MAG: pilus assembly protein, partial [Planctomycetes bacterium]|nr:pilus assembly protein [Planctomycetota bacterium]